HYDTHPKHRLYLPIHRTPKLPFTLLLPPLPFSTHQQIVHLLPHTQYLRNTLQKHPTQNTQHPLLHIYQPLRPPQPPTVQNPKTLLYSPFFDPKP
ncbi:hypothetical protein, partial [Staphylococcus epidermidis]|uniref:hypothetical protein n=1 Tax=Staphylococcus epidermidis TaxID=1282 RepID=UPI001C92F40F